MNITLSAEEETIGRARKWAIEHGTSLNAVIRDYLESLGNDLEVKESADLYRTNAVSHSGKSSGALRFLRSEIYQGKRFGK